MGEKNWNGAVIVALGSNLSGAYESSEAALRAALSAFPEIGLIVKAKSSFWRSAAWPDPTGPAYLNGVAIVGAEMAPEAVLRNLHRLEARFGRQRTEINQPRVLDLDLIAYGRQVITNDDLVLPHPRAASRRFVMGPLAEIAPGWRHPLLGLTAEILTQSAPVGQDAASHIKA